MADRLNQDPESVTHLSTLVLVKGPEDTQPTSGLVLKRIKSLCPEGSTACDKIPPIVLKQCSKVNSAQVHNPFRHLLDSHQLPSESKQVTLPPIVKTSDRKHLVCRRLTSLSEVMEGLASEQMLEYMGKKHPPPSPTCVQEGQVVGIQFAHSVGKLDNLMDP